MYFNCSTPLLHATVDAIVTKIAPERIYLLGTRKCREQIENVFGQVAMPETVIGFQLLILLPFKDKRDEEELNRSVDKNYPAGATVTSIIVPVNVFNKWLDRGNLLAHHAWHGHQLVYETGKSIAREPGIYDLEALRNGVHAEAAFLLKTAIHQYKGALYYREEKQFKLAAFTLHQTAEHSLMAIIRLVTGYRAGTHNLQRLLRYAHVFCGVSPYLFPGHQQQEKLLLKLLQDAYIGARYKESYQLTEAQYLLLEYAIETLLSNVQIAFETILSGYSITKS
jgi:HEPN domain-containing protein